MRNLYFYNHAHNGDIFTSRYMVRDVVQQLGKLGRYWNFQYAVRKHINQKILRDLGVPLTTSDDGEALLLDHSFHLNRFKHTPDLANIYVNTWVGCYDRLGLWHCNHPSYFYLHKIWQRCYEEMAAYYGISLEWNPDPWYYVPDIEYGHYETKLVDDFLAAHPKTYLFCNGHVWSLQSNMDNMHSLIENLATQYTDTTFLATEHFPTTLSNIKFTRDVFNLESDICEISYLSTRVNLVVGKNSGPFTYANTRRNLQDASKIFVCFSNHAVDTLPFRLNIAADFRFSNTIYPYFALETVTNAIEDERGRKQISGFAQV